MEYIIRRLLESANHASEWIGGAPWEDDLFYENAKRLGLEVEQENIDVRGNALEFDYVILKSPVIFYHATTSDRVESILSQGLTPQIQAGGKYVSGVFLAGATESLSRWRGKDTQVLQVILQRGTKVYQDRQSNAIFIRERVPSEDISLIAEGI